jgi:hypothetical protein
MPSPATARPRTSSGSRLRLRGALAPLPFEVLAPRNTSGRPWRRRWHRLFTRHRLTRTGPLLDDARLVALERAFSCLLLPPTPAGYGAASPQIAARDASLGSAIAKADEHREAKVVRAVAAADDKTAVSHAGARLSHARHERMTADFRQPCARHAREGHLLRTDQTACVQAPRRGRGFFPHW